MRTFHSVHAAHTTALRLALEERGVPVFSILASSVHDEFKEHRSRWAWGLLPGDSIRVYPVSVHVAADVFPSPYIGKTKLFYAKMRMEDGWWTPHYSGTLLDMTDSFAAYFTQYWQRDLTRARERRHKERLAQGG